MVKINIRVVLEKVKKAEIDISLKMELVSILEPLAKHFILPVEENELRQ